MHIFILLAVGLVAFRFFDSEANDLFSTYFCGAVLVIVIYKLLVRLFKGASSHSSSHDSGGSWFDGIGSGDGGSDGGGGGD